MINDLELNVKVVRKHAYMADRLDDVYLVHHMKDALTYGITCIHKRNGEVVEEIKKPTQTQKEYALLNYILEDNQNNIHKSGIYNFDIDLLTDAYLNVLFGMKKANVSTESIFNKFALNPNGEYMQAALNDLVKDILIGRKGFVKPEALSYVVREEQPVDNVVYERAEDDEKYLVEPKMSKYSFKIVRIQGNRKIEVENPTKEQCENALLNLVIEDNFKNPSKSGVYNKDVEQIKTEFYHALNGMKKEQSNDKSKLLKKFGLDYSGEYMICAVGELTDKVLGLDKEKSL